MVVEIVKITIAAAAVSNNNDSSISGQGASYHLCLQAILWHIWVCIAQFLLGLRNSR